MPVHTTKYKHDNIIVLLQHCLCMLCTQSKFYLNAHCVCRDFDKYFSSIVEISLYEKMINNYWLI